MKEKKDKKDLDEDDPNRDSDGYDPDGNPIDDRDDAEDNPGEGFVKEEEVEVQEGESLEDIKAKLKPKKSAISAEMLDTANTYDDKVAVIRMIVGDEAGKVSNVFRQLMKKDAL